MPDRSLNWGNPADSGTRWQTQDDDPNGGGNFVVLRDLDGDTVLFQYDPVDGEWQYFAPVSMGALTTESLNDADFTTAAAGTAPVSQGDGTLAMENIETATEIDLLDLETANDLPDLSTLSKPTIAYIDNQDDYVGAFQA